MKLSISSLPLMAFMSTMMRATLVTSSESIHQYTQVSLDGVEGEMHGEEKIYFEETFADAYNIVHKHGEGAQVEVTSLTLDSLGADDRRGLRGADSIDTEHRKLPGSWAGGWTGGNCNFCFRRELSEQEERQANEEADMPGDVGDLHRRFELTLAAIAREGPFSYFHTLTDVTVDFGATPPDRN